MPRSLSAETQLVFRSADSTCGASEVATLTRAVQDWGRALWLAEKEVATFTSVYHNLVRLWSET